MTKKQIEAGLESHHWRTIFWFDGDLGYVIEVVVLATYKEGIAIKPYDVDEAVEASKELSWLTEEQIRAPEFCFTTCKKRGSEERYRKSLERFIKAFDKYEDVYCLEEHISTGFTGDSPTCGHV